MLAILRNVCQFLMSFGILYVGVGLKFALAESYAEYKRDHAWTLVGGLAFTYFWMHVCRFTNFCTAAPDDAVRYDVPEFRFRYSLLTRRAIWCIQIVLGLAVLPLVLTIDTAQAHDEEAANITSSTACGDHSTHGPATTAGLYAGELLAILLAMTLFSAFLELFCLPTSAESRLAEVKQAGPPIFDHALFAGSVRHSLPLVKISGGRTGKDLWDVLRSRVLHWARKRRTARAFEEASSGALCQPGNLRLPVSSSSVSMDFRGSPVEEPRGVLSYLHRRSLRSRHSQRSEKARQSQRSQQAEAAEGVSPVRSWRHIAEPSHLTPSLESHLEDYPHEMLNMPTGPSPVALPALRPSSALRQSASPQPPKALPSLRVTRSSDDEDVEQESSRAELMGSLRAEWTSDV